MFHYKTSKEILRKSRRQRQLELGNQFIRASMFIFSTYPIQVVFGFAVDISEVFLWGVPEHRQPKLTFRAVGRYKLVLRNTRPLRIL